MDSLRDCVLIVDDDDIIRQTLRLVLEQEGYSVVTAQNGKEALQALAQDPSILAITLDLNMPVMSGYEFLKTKRADQTIAHIPVIIMSSLPPAYMTGVERIMTKPIDVDVLLLALEDCKAKLAD